MEFVGRAVKKVVKGVGIVTGTVKSYDPSSGLVEILYDDGDSEELESSEVLSLLEGAQPELAKPKRRVGRPRKRRRVDRKAGAGAGASSGNASENLVSEGSEFRMISEGNGSDAGNLGVGSDRLGFGIEGNSDLGNGNGGNLVSNVNGSVDSIGSDGTVGRVIEAEGNLNNAVVSANGNCVRDALDLNASLNLNEDLNLYDVPLDDTEGGGLKRRNCIDLNLDVNGEDDGNPNSGCLGTGKMERSMVFDLNVEVVCEEVKETQGDVEGNGFYEANAVLGRTGQFQGEMTNTNQRSTEGDGVRSDLNEVPETIISEANHVSAEHAVFDDSLCLIEGEEGDGNKEEAAAIDSFQVLNAISVGAQQIDSLSEAGFAVTHEHQDEPGSICPPETGRRKRRKTSDDVTTTPETLRRSSRRASARKQASIHIASPVMDGPMLSVGPSTTTEENPVTSGCVQHEQNSAPPSKLQLPPPSQNLNLDDVPVLQLFSIYSCLRSFSTLLFLSPFELEDLVAALKSRTPSTLFDSIHVSILETLRKHLEYLSSEGCQSASDCLRNLNWDFLDVLTWPIFMAEYLLIHGSDFNLNYSIFKTDYYQQPACVKVEILQYLCDNMIEAETLRSELNRRSLVTENSIGFDQNMYFDTGKKRRAVTDVSGGSSLTEEIVDDTNDWNSDECCLCKMDGNLICCDGCPAAFHSRCVGIACENLPEGDWYCPECAIGAHRAWMKTRRSLRGADLVGTDIDGRIYFSSYGYLLVSHSSDAESLFNYYHRNDLHAVLEVLKSAGTLYYGSILRAIYRHLDIPANSNVEASNLVVFNQSSCKNMHIMGEYSTMQTSLAAANRLDSTTTIESPCIASEGSADTTQTRSGNENLQISGLHGSNRSDESLNQSGIPENQHSVGGCSLVSSSLDLGLKMNLRSVGASCAPSTNDKDTSEVPFGIDYINYYSFARTASLIAQELMCKLPEKMNKNLTMSEEDIMSDQAKAIMKKSTNFYWPSIQNLNVAAQKEKCGWCFSCKVATDDRDCLFNYVMKPVWEVSESTFASLQLRKIPNGHLRDIICHILSLEDRLRGLLLGPWLNSHQTNLWRKDLMKTSDLSPVKQLLLLLESNLRHFALSADWLKHVDSIGTMGSATHIVVSSSRTSSRHGVGKKRARYSDIEPNSSSKSASGLGIYWWRGGRLSRQLFNCKNLPHSLVAKAARQAGCTKIPGILYPENSDFARRSKYVAWRAAVEMATSVEQLALQVRELYSYIKWRDIENNHPQYVLDKESKKSTRLFKKAIVRRKCTEGQSVKYLIDFGKRRAIPDIVIRYGSLLEEPSNERKKYWLDESHVPLHLLKNFEERRIVRKSDDRKLGKVIEIGRVNKKAPRDRGFPYLFTRMERSDCHQCGHCQKDVPIRDAVSCLYCEGYFHKTHVRKCSGTSSTECTYSCRRCRDGMSVKTATKKTKRRKVDSQLQKTQSPKSKSDPSVCKSVSPKGNKKALSKVRKVKSRTNKKILPSIPLRRSTRKAKSLYMHSQINGGRKKGIQSKKNAKNQKVNPRGRKRGKQNKPMKMNNENPKETTSRRKKFAETAVRKKRSNICSSHWLNGLWLSRKPNDKRVMVFREKNCVVSSEDFSAAPGQPKCCLCSGDGCTSNYIACEICGDWFHGDAFGLSVEKSRQLIGFKCHVCRGRASPICPHMKSKVLSCNESNAATECAEELSNSVSLQPLSEVCLPLTSPNCLLAWCYLENGMMKGQMSKSHILSLLVNEMKILGIKFV